MAKDLSGAGIANPTATLLSTAMMLRHIKLANFADRLEKAVLKVPCCWRGMGGGNVEGCACLGGGDEQGHRLQQQLPIGCCCCPLGSMPT